MIIDTKKASLILLATIFLLAIVLRFYQLDRVLGGHDENAMLLYFGYAPLKAIVTNYWDVNNHIFHTILVRIMGIFFGEENSIAIRLPTLLFGLASLWMIYRVALDLFNSNLIAHMALLIAAINPTHIHYSQTARGYSLIIFFSTVMILLSLKVLRSEASKTSGIVITLCGFLSVYTVPTNLYFLFGLATWILVTLFLTDSQKKFFKDKKERGQKGLFFLKVALGIAACCLAAYAPVLSQLTETIRNHQTMTIETQWQGLSFLIPGIFEKVFPHSLLIFIPLLILGLCYKNSLGHSYRSLFFIVFFLPFSFILINDMRGYPRNYLYNFPILIVFMAAGMAHAGNLCGRLFKNKNTSRWTALGICAVYSILSINILFHKYFPSLKTSNGREIQKNISQFTHAHDLIAVQNPENYIYTRKQYRNNLINIYNNNRLNGFNLVAPKNYDLFKYTPGQEREVFQIIKKLWGQITFKTFNLDQENTMTLMTGPSSIPLIPDSFEESTQWKILNGKGTISKSKPENTFDRLVLKLETSSENEMLAMRTIPNTVKVSKPSMVVLVWTVKMNYKELINQPALLVKLTSPNDQYMQVGMGRINSGMNIYLGDSFLTSSNWFLRSAIGIVPPGNHSFSILLKCNKNQTILYDEFRVFLIELADNK